MPSSTRSNKETQLLFSPDPASFERSIRKEARSSSTDNNTCVSLDSSQPPSTQTLVSSTDTCSPLSTDNTHLPSTNILHLTSIDTPSRTSIDTEPRDMVAPLILVRDNNEDMHDQEGHLRNAARREAAKKKRFRGRKVDEFQRIAMVSIDARPRPLIDIHQSKSIDRNSRASIDDAYGVNRVLKRREDSNSRGVRSKTPTSMPKIDVARLNALRPKPKPSEYPPVPVRTPSDDGKDPMEEDRVPTKRTLRRRKEKVAKHLKMGANDKEKESFRKRVFRILIDKPFEDAYYTHRLWMFFRETKEKEEDIRRMFCEAREKMRMRITLKTKSDPGQFAIPCTVKGIEFPHTLCDTGASVSILPRIGNALVPVDFHVLDIKLNWNSSLLLGRAFLSTVGVVCNLQTNQLCLTLIDPNAHYDPIPVKTLQTISRRINDPGIIAACHCGAEYEMEYSASIETHTATSIDSSHQKSTDIQHDESVDSCPDDWENDYYTPAIAAYTREYMHREEYDEEYEEELATEYRAILDEEDKLLHHSPGKGILHRST
ncbi:hypothetical protein F2Q69_00029069 [Brassica cretica]|uniref:Aspartic peptidase DDI1-type domain-containing protein n=1 Tax=Brassica cretica TaxID=69181 RepID=A0A8S9RVM6_BRACR|nr:hypothetical protein F2Q69_00029069 [Brassica cretica]